MMSKTLAEYGPSFSFFFVLDFLLSFFFLYIRTQVHSRLDVFIFGRKRIVRFDNFCPMPLIDTWILSTFIYSNLKNAYFSNFNQTVRRTKSPILQFRDTIWPLQIHEKGGVTFITKAQNTLCDRLPNTTWLLHVQQLPYLPRKLLFLSAEKQHHGFKPWHFWKTLHICHYPLFDFWKDLWCGKGDSKGFEDGDKQRGFQRGLT